MKSIYFCHIRWFCHGLVGFSLSATPDLNSPRNPSAHIDNDQLVQVNSICLHVTPLSKKKTLSWKSSSQMDPMSHNWYPTNPIKCSSSIN